MIREQHADNIYNIQGGMHLHQSEEVAALLNRQKQAELRSLTSIEFLDVLKGEYAKQKLISREYLLEEIRAKLESSQQLLLHGDPGIGKTTLLYQFIQANEVVYISVKEKPSINVFFYLINKVRRRNNKDLVESANVDQAINYLQAELQETDQYFFIDDCEQNVDMVSSLIAIEKFKSKFLFASRNKTLFESQAIHAYQCKPFTEAEVKLFLQAYSIQTGLIDFNGVVQASRGNPLYLLYYSRNQINPPPKSIDEFQAQIWSKLDWEQQEILASVCVSNAGLTVTELSDIREIPPAKLVGSIDLLAPLIKNTEGTLEAFHPSFEEFVKSQVTSKGLYEHYARKIGEYWLKNEKVVEATYMLIDIDPERLSDYLFDVFRSLMGWGELEFAAKVLTTKLRMSKTDLERGYASYHLCTTYHLLGNQQASTEAIDNALVFLQNTKSEDILASAKMFKAMDLIKHGKIQDATVLADTVFDEVKDKDYKAPILVNLSKIYLDLYEFEKGANACREAYDIFEKENDGHGMLTASLNLVSCLGQIPAFLDEAESHGLALLELIRKEAEFGMEVVVLNSLSSICRQKGNYEKARAFAMQAVRLCQKHLMKEKVIRNLINYANIVRDEGNTDESLTIYDEALTYATQYNLKKEIGRIFWIFAGIYREKNDLDRSLEYAEKSITSNGEIDFFYGVANAFCEKAETLKLKSDNVGAAQALEQAAVHYGRIHEFRKSRQQRLNEAIALYMEAGLTEDVNRVLAIWIDDTREDLQYNLLFEQVSDIDKPSYTFNNFEKIFVNYFTDTNAKINLIRQFLLYIGYCKKFKDVGGKKHYLKIVRFIISNLGHTKYSHSILGFSLEQSGELLTMNDVIEIGNELQTKLSFFSLRHVNEELIIIVTVRPSLNLEIHVFDDEPVCLKLALALVLILCEEPYLVLDENKQTKSLHCPMWIHHYSDAYKNALKENLPDESVLYDKEMQSAHMEKTGYDIQEIIIIGREYEKYCDLNAYPDEKSSFYFFTKTCMGIKAHLYQEDIVLVADERKRIYRYAADLFDYVDIEEKKEERKSYPAPDISKLEDKLSGPKHGKAI